MLPSTMTRALLVMCARPEFKQGDWTYAECGASSVFALRDSCLRCGAPKMGSPGRRAEYGDYGESSSRRGPPGGASFKPGDWTCAECGASPVFASRDSCFRCGAPKPTKPTPAAPPEFRQNWEGTRCFVENLSYDTDWKMLKDAF